MLRTREIFRSRTCTLLALWLSAARLATSEVVRWPQPLLDYNIGGKSEEFAERTPTLYDFRHHFRVAALELLLVHHGARSCSVAKNDDPDALAEHTLPALRKFCEKHNISAGRLDTAEATWLQLVVPLKPGDRSPAVLALRWLVTASREAARPPLWDPSSVERHACEWTFDETLERELLQRVPNVTSATLNEDGVTSAIWLTLFNSQEVPACKGCKHRAAVARAFAGIWVALWFGLAAIFVVKHMDGWKHIDDRFASSSALRKASFIGSDVIVFLAMAVSHIFAVLGVWSFPLEVASQLLVGFSLTAGALVAVRLGAVRRPQASSKVGKLLLQVGVFSLLTLSLCMLIALIPKLRSTWSVVRLLLLTLAWAMVTALYAERRSWTRGRLLLVLCLCTAAGPTLTVSAGVEIVSRSSAWWAVLVPVLILAANVLCEHNVGRLIVRHCEYTAETQWLLAMLFRLALELVRFMFALAVLLVSALEAGDHAGGLWCLVLYVFENCLFDILLCVGPQLRQMIAAWWTAPKMQGDDADVPLTALKAGREASLPFTGPEIVLRVGHIEPWAYRMRSAVLPIETVLLFAHLCQLVLMGMPVGVPQTTWWAGIAFIASGSIIREAVTHFVAERAGRLLPQIPWGQLPAHLLALMIGLGMSMVSYAQVNLFWLLYAHHWAACFVAAPSNRSVSTVSDDDVAPAVYTGILGGVVLLIDIASFVAWLRWASLTRKNSSLSGFYYGGLNKSASFSSQLALQGSKAGKKSQVMDDSSPRQPEHLLRDAASSLSDGVHSWTDGHSEFSADRLPLGKDGLVDPLSPKSPKTPMGATKSNSEALQRQGSKEIDMLRDEAYRSLEVRKTASMGGADSKVAKEDKVAKEVIRLEAELEGTWGRTLHSLWQEDDGEEGSPDRASGSPPSGLPTMEVHTSWVSEDSRGGHDDPHYALADQLLRSVAEGAGTNESFASEAKSEAEAAILSDTSARRDLQATLKNASAAGTKEFPEAEAAGDLESPTHQRQEHERLLDDLLHEVDHAEKEVEKSQSRRASKGMNMEAAQKEEEQAAAHAAAEQLLQAQVDDSGWSVEDADVKALLGHADSSTLTYDTMSVDGLIASYENKDIDHSSTADQLPKVQEDAVPETAEAPAAAPGLEADDAAAKEAAEEAEKEAAAANAAAKVAEEAAEAEAKAKAEAEAAAAAAAAAEEAARLEGERLEKERLEKEAAEREAAAREQAAREAAEREQRAREEAAAREQAAREQAAREAAERERLAREAAERERLAREAAEKAAREAAEREEAARREAAREAAKQRVLLAIEMRSREDLEASLEEAAEQQLSEALVKEARQVVADIIDEENRQMAAEDLERAVAGRNIDNLRMALSRAKEVGLGCSMVGDSLIQSATERLDELLAAKARLEAAQKRLKEAMQRSENGSAEPLAKQISDLEGAIREGNQVAVPSSEVELAMQRVSHLIARRRREDAVQAMNDAVAAQSPDRINAALAEARAAAVDGAEIARVEQALNYLLDELELAEQKEKLLFRRIEYAMAATQQAELADTSDAVARMLSDGGVLEALREAINEATKTKMVKQREIQKAEAVLSEVSADLKRILAEKRLAEQQQAEEKLRGEMQHAKQSKPLTKLVLEELSQAIQAAMVFTSNTKEAETLLKQLADEHEKETKRVQDALDAALKEKDIEGITAAMETCTKMLLEEATERALAQIRGIITQDIAIAHDTKDRDLRLDMVAKLSVLINILRTNGDTKLRQFHNELQDLKGALRVFCRVRPQNKKELAQKDSIAIKTMDAFTVLANKSQDDRPVFNYDAIFGPQSTQAEVFAECRSLVQSAVDGYNVTIFTYGQTGAGKTWTLYGTGEQPGISPRTCEEVFRTAGRDSDRLSFDISASMVELYLSDLRDLIVSKKGKDAPKLEFKSYRQADGSIGTRLEGTTETKVTNAQQLAQVVAAGLKNRKVRETKMNADSSRSHLLLVIRIRITDKASGRSHEGKVTIVDLAGSERIGKSGVSGEAQKEAIEINKSLTALGDVMMAITSRSKTVPYRNHKLTQLMQDSLGGTAKTLMFVNVSPSSSNVDETINALKYASRARSIENDVQCHSAAPTPAPRGHRGANTPAGTARH
eukprot:TRINITY_DN4322_c0_g3_i2.p1 TRINITY_DN4322_c0_g3~~TRINITY_DN4322_c0_g3_i2.p1  ORF type:complete len:2117 (-),score=567.74 TRINITY_DN4322_c0_g3_i2:339-6689(-)